jgi:hypothetical protein
VTAHGPNARAGAVSRAAAALDAELADAPVDEYFTLILRACAHGGRLALSSFCDAVEDPSKELDEAPALTLAAALDDHVAADAAVRAVAWAMAAQRFAETWPRSFYEVLEVARVAMPLTNFDFERMQILSSLSAAAMRPGGADEREGVRAQFSRESLEHVIAAATGRRPARRDMLLVIPPWTACFIRGIHACDERLLVLEAQHPGVAGR